MSFLSDWELQKLTRQQIPIPALSFLTYRCWETIATGTELEIFQQWNDLPTVGTLGKYRIVNADDRVVAQVKIRRSAVSFLKFLRLKNERNHSTVLD